MAHKMINKGASTIAGIVEMQPEVVFSHENEHFCKTVLSVKRRSGISDKLPVIISESLIDESLKVGMIVKMTGQLRSTSFLDKSGREHSRIFFFSNSVEKADVCQNDIHISGYINEEPVHRITPFSGREIAEVVLRVPRGYTGRNDYIRCILWGHEARYVATLGVGDALAIDGRLQSRTYTKIFQNGETTERTTYELSAYSIERL